MNVETPSIHIVSGRSHSTIDRTCAFILVECIYCMLSMTYGPNTTRYVMPHKQHGVFILECVTAKPWHQLQNHTVTCQSTLIWYFLWWIDNYNIVCTPCWAWLMIKTPPGMSCHTNNTVFWKKHQFCTCTNSTTTVEQAEQSSEYRLYSPAIVW